MSRRGDVANAAGDAEVFGAAAGLEVRAGVGGRRLWRPGWCRGVWPGLGEEVVEVEDLVADGAVEEAGRVGEVSWCDAEAAVGGEDEGGGVEDGGAALAIALSGAGARGARLDLGAHAAGWDGGHAR